MTTCVPRAPGVISQAEKDAGAPAAYISQAIDMAVQDRCWFQKVQLAWLARYPLRATSLIYFLVRKTSRTQEAGRVAQETHMVRSPQ